MGGRVVAQLCATEPERALGVILVDAIVGDTWDRMVNVGRLFPPAMAGVAISSSPSGLVAMWRKSRRRVW